MIFNKSWLTRSFLWVIAETSLCFKMLESNRLHSGGKTQKIMWTWIIFFRRVDAVKAKWHALNINCTFSNQQYVRIQKHCPTTIFLFFRVLFDEWS